jgi:GNAT superfamily N-acetyltransferase
MPSGDMLVQLLKLPSREPLVEEMRRAGVVIKQASSFEMSPVLEFVRTHWGVGWADEVSVAFTRQPVTVFIALHEGELVGFCVYEATRRDYLGPMGVLESERKKGVGKALLISALWGLREMGYAYAIIGGVGPVEFYSSCCGATLIADSSPGVYTDRIKKKT